MKVLIIGGCGYIGRRLCIELSPEFDVDTVDLEWFGSRPNNIKLDFNDLTQENLVIYEAIILLAGHSSVQMCERDMASAFNNNVRNFVSLLGKISDQKFIYASSSSLYAGLQNVAREDEDKYKATNYYDLSKREIDYYAELSDKEYYGLRFGTVNGYSPNLREELMLNKMLATAQKTGNIEIFNSHVRRPILGIKDLSNSVRRILRAKAHRGIYNLASFNSTVLELATVVASKTGATIVDKGRSPTYDFAIDTSKFSNTFGYQFSDTAESIVEELIQNVNFCSTNRLSRVPYA